MKKNFTYKPFCFFLFAVVGFYSCSGSYVTVQSDDMFDMLELPDGSVVYLNQNSSVRYKRSFESRSIELDGEALFDVKQGEAMPFTVVTKMGVIKVMGTLFNVNSRSDEIRVEVERGEVELNTNNLVKPILEGGAASYKTGQEYIQTSEAHYQYKIWMKALKRAFKEQGKEVKYSVRRMEKETRKLGREIRKRVDKLKIN